MLHSAFDDIEGLQQARTRRAVNGALSAFSRGRANALVALRNGSTPAATLNGVYNDAGDFEQYEVAGDVVEEYVIGP